MLITYVYMWRWWGFLDQVKVRCNNHVYLVQNMRIDYECSGDSGVLTEMKYDAAIMSAQGWTWCSSHEYSIEHKITIMSTRWRAWCSKHKYLRLYGLVIMSIWRRVWFNNHEYLNMEMVIIVRVVPSKWRMVYMQWMSVKWMTRVIEFLQVVRLIRNEPK